MSNLPPPGGWCCTTQGGVTLTEDDTPLLIVGGKVLFLYRPRQTWMPYRLPRQTTQQDAYNRHLQKAYEATRRVPRGAPGAVNALATAVKGDTLADLKELAELHATGALSDEEFATAKATVLGAEEHRS